LDAGRGDWLLDFGRPERLERPSERDPSSRNASIAGLPPTPTRVA
jgi:hypothetical protein